MTTAEKISGNGPTMQRIYEPSTEAMRRLPDLPKTISKRARHTRSPPPLHQPDLPRDRPGALAMLKESDELWLRDAHPALIPAGNAITGGIEFRASYGQQTNRFLILADHTADPIDAVTLSGAFQIRIEERSDKSDSRLPALYVQGIDPTTERHFNQRDKSACLCSPFDENDFLEPEFQFRPFFERLVIPFLYGQVFCSSKGHWPWAEYAHGATGILEAYSKVRDQNRTEQCLQKLAQDMSWPK